MGYVTEQIRKILNGYEHIRCFLTFLALFSSEHLNFGFPPSTASSRDTTMKVVGIATEEVDTYIIVVQNEYQYYSSNMIVL